MSMALQSICWYFVLWDLYQLDQLEFKQGSCIRQCGSVHAHDFNKEKTKERKKAERKGKGKANRKRGMTLGDKAPNPIRKSFIVNYLFLA